MAALLARTRVRQTHQSLHHLVADAPWEAEVVLQAVREYALAAIEKRGPIQAWIVDDSGFPKFGRCSVGVARQYCGALGKVGNCQIGVSINAATDAASCPLDWRVFLPEEWDSDLQRRANRGNAIDTVDLRYSNTPFVTLKTSNSSSTNSVSVSDLFNAQLTVQLKDKDPQLLRAVLGLDLRASIQDSMTERGREILDVLQKTFPENSLDILVLLVKQLNVQIQQLKAQGESAKPQLEKLVKSFATFLDVLARQQEKDSKAELLLFLAQSYSTLDNHSRAAELAGKIEQPKPDGDKKEPDPRKLRGPGPQHGLMIERIERRLEPFQDRAGACGRELLGDHDRGEAREAVGTFAQRRPSGGRQRLLEARVGPHQRSELREGHLHHLDLLVLVGDAAAGGYPVVGAVLGEIELDPLGGDAGHGIGAGDVDQRAEPQPRLLHRLAPHALRRIVLVEMQKPNLSADEGRAFVAVSDTGLGIPLEQQPLVFKRFFRADVARSRAAGRSSRRTRRPARTCRTRRPARWPDTRRTARR